MDPELKKYEVQVMWRKKGQHKIRTILAKDTQQAKAIAFERFGVNRGVRLKVSK